MKTEVFVCDAIMGSGKTSAAVTYMREHRDERFLYITPGLKEDDRIRDTCPDLNFKKPGVNDVGEYQRKFKSKSEDLQNLAKRGYNIVSTHALFVLMTPATAKIFKEQGYTLIVDEALEVVRTGEIKRRDLEVMERDGIISIDENNNLTVLRNTYDSYLQAKIDEMLLGRYACVKQGKNGDVLFWVLSDGIINSFLKVFILCYRFKGTVMLPYFHMHNIEYKNIYIDHPDADTYRFTDTLTYIPHYVGHLHELINIYEGEKNVIGEKMTSLSSSWYKEMLKKGRRNKKKEIGAYELAQIRGHIHYFFYGLHPGGTHNDRLWTVYKNALNSVMIKGMSNNFLECRARSTNKYRHCTQLAYMINLHITPELKILVAMQNIKFSDNEYALEGMIQWIWRSAIRDGKPIDIYIPSRRMRGLLKNWIAEVEQEYWDFQNTNKAS